MPHYNPGDQIEIEFLLGNDPFIVMPTTVVTDGSDRLMHYIAAGTRYLIRRQRSGEPVPRVVSMADYESMATHLVPHEWRLHALAITVPGLAHGIRVMFDRETWAFTGWYVNLQRPLERTARGFRTRDDFLDIQVPPDGRWRWKDEDEIELAVERHRLTSSEAAAIRAEGERVVEKIGARHWPFDHSLDGWRPNPEWPVPVLRDAWNEAP